MSVRDFQHKLQSIRELERGTRPDPAWKQRTRATLLMQVSNNLPIASPSLSFRIREAFLRFVPTQWIAVVRGPALATLSVIGVVAGGSIASVSAAERAIPGDFLYPIKLATEQTRLILVKSKTDKLKLKTDFVERRVKEIKTIVYSDVSERPERIRTAAEILKRDLDTVKIQLNDVSNDEQTAETTEAVKLIDKKSSEVASDLKDVKASVPEEAKEKITQAETAAVTTGIKAVQMLIDSQDHPETRGVMTQDELTQTIQGKVQGIEEHMANAAQRILSTTTSTVPAPSVGEGSDSIPPSTQLDVERTTASATVSLLQIKNAQQSLDETKQSLQEKKLTEVKDGLGEAAKAMVSAETAADSAVAASTAAALSSNAAASSSTPVPSPTNATTTPASSHGAVSSTASGGG